MRLDPSTLDELSTFYARRLPDGAGSVARAVGLPAPEGSGAAAWHDLLVTADATGRTGRVARLVADRLPGDENAREAARNLGPVIPVARWAVGAAAAAAVVLAVGVAAAMSSGAAQADVKHPDVSPAALVAPEAIAPTPSTSPSPTAATPLAARHDAHASLTSAQHTLPSACRGSGSEAIGWWYAGTSAPGAQGETITLRRGATVRSAPPSAEHGWRMEPAVRCGLSAGDTITVGQVRAMPGGFYWVELPG